MLDTLKSKSRKEVFAFILLTVFLVLLFLIIFLPKAEIFLEVASEPLIFDLKVKLSNKTEKILFNLETIPAKLILKEEIDKFSPDDWLRVEDPDQNDLMVFYKQDLDQFINQKLNQLFQNKQMIFTSYDFDWTNESLDFNKGQAVIKVLIKAEVTRAFDIKDISEKLTNQDIESARIFLENLEDVKRAEIEIWPKWRKKLPQISSRINLTPHPKIFMMHNIINK